MAISSARFKHDRKVALPGSSMESALINFLEQYRKLLLALKHNHDLRPNISLGLSKMLFLLSSVINIQLQKIKTYATLHPNGLDPMNRPYLELETQKELNLHRIVHSLKKHAIELDPSMYPFYKNYLNEINRYYARKRKLFTYECGHPGPPWINPSIKKRVNGE